MASIVKTCGFIVVLLGLGGCTQDKKSPISVEDSSVELVRFDRALWEARQGDSIDGLIDNHSLFSEVYGHHVIGSHLDPGMDIKARLDSFAGLPWYEKILDTFSHIVPNITKYEQGLKDAVVSYGRVFGKDTLPTVYLCISGWDYGAFTIGDEAVGIALEFYLGSDFPYPSYELFPLYVRRSMNADHMAVRAIRALVEGTLTPPSTERMIDVMCHNGKVLYFMDQILAETPDTALFDYSSEELEWCRANLFDMWRFFIEEDLIYETDLRRIGRYINPAPHSAGMPDCAPGRTANWLGYQIIKKWVNQARPSLNSLIEMTDGQAILEASQFRGR